MSTRLTNFVREAFIRSVMNDIPNVDYQADATKIAQEAVLTAFKKRFSAMSELDLAEAKSERWLSDRGYFSLPTPFNYCTVPGAGCSNMEFLKTLDGGRIWNRLENLANSQKLQNARNEKLRADLKAVVYSCTTVKSLKEKLPEFSKYLPNDSSAPTSVGALTVTNVAQQFRDAGWPKLSPA